MTLKALVIDDSAYNRYALRLLLESIPGVTVAATAVDGVDGLKQTMKVMPDVIILDLEMPNMDGFSFLRLLKGVRKVPVIVVSGKRWECNARRVLELGAVEFIEKPTMHASLSLLSIKDELARKLGMVPPLAALGAHGARSGAVINRALWSHSFDAVVIGASTGGPKAVSAVLRKLPRDYPASIAVAIHFPPWLTVPFAERLRGECEIDVSIAAHGEPVGRGRVVIAPGGYNVTIVKKGGVVRTELRARKHGDICAPSVDTLFSSAADVWGPGLTGVVMTGMGRDGAQGAVRIKEKGGYVIAESGESSTISSMPDAAISTGAVDAVLPGCGIGEALAKRRHGKGAKSA